MQLQQLLNGYTESLVKIQEQPAPTADLQPSKKQIKHKQIIYLSPQTEVISPRRRSLELKATLNTVTRRASDLNIGTPQLLSE